MPVVTPPTCFSWNVNGFTAENRTRLWEYYEKLLLDVCFFQEHTLASTLKVIKRPTELSLRPPVAGVWRPPCKTETFLGLKTAIILFGDNWDIKHTHHTDCSSVVQARRRSDDTYWHFVSLYLSVNTKERGEFLKNPKNLRDALQLDHVKPGVQVIVAGDMNEIMDSIDVYRTRMYSDHGPKLARQMAPLVDAFRYRHPDVRAFSSYRRQRRTKKIVFTRRIDLIWSSADVARAWKWIGYVPEIGASDHSVLVATTAPWKPDNEGLSQAKMEWWNFPRHLLKQPKVAQRVRQLFQLLHPSSTPAEFQRFFDRLPALLEAEKARHGHQRPTDQALMAAHSRLRALVTSTTPTAVEDLAEATRHYEELRLELHPEERQSVSRTHRDAVQWVSHRKHCPPPPMSSSDVQAGVEHLVAQPAAPTQGVRDDRQHLLQSAAPFTATPGMTDPFTTAEALRRLRRMSSTSAAGPNGLPTAVLKEGGEAAAAAAAAVLNVLASLDVVPDELTVRLRGLLLCKWKKGLSDKNFDNYRLLAIADAEIRLLHAIVADRLKDWLAGLHGGQTGFMPGRNVAEGPLEMLIVASAVARGFYTGPATLLVQDQSKAYDRVDHGWLFAALKAYGLSLMLIVLLQRLMANVTVTCLTSEGATTAIPIRRGLPQGLATSVFLYLVALQPLMDSWRASGCGVRLTCNDAAADPTQHTLLTHGAYADNTFWWFRSLRDRLHHGRLRQRYDNSSGSLLNQAESFIISLNGDAEADVIDPSREYRRRPKEKTFTYLGRPINMAGKSSLDLDTVRLRIAKASSLFRHHMSIFVKAQIMTSYGWGSVAHYMELANFISDKVANLRNGRVGPLPKELREISEWLRTGLFDGNGHRISGRIAFKPRHLGGLGMPPPFESSEMRLLRICLSTLVTGPASPSASSSSSSSNASSHRPSPSSSPLTATLQHHLTHLSLKERKRTWLADVLAPMERHIAEGRAWEAWDLRFLRALQRARITLTRKPDWSTFSAAEVGEMPIWHPAYELEPIYYTRGVGHRPPVFSLTPPYPGAVPWACDGWGFPELYRHGLGSFSSLLFFLARKADPSSTEPLLRLGVGPPTKADLRYWTDSFDLTRGSDDGAIRQLQFAWPLLLARYPVELKNKLLELMQEGSPREVTGAKPPPSAARPLRGSPCRRPFPWRAFDVAGVPAADFAIGNGLDAVVDATVERPGVASLTTAAPQPGTWSRTDNGDEEDAPEVETSKWRERVNYRRLWYDVKRYQLPGTSRDSWYLVCWLRCTMVRDEKYRVAACGSCSVQKALSDHLYIECPATQDFWRGAALLAWEVTGKRADEPPPASDFAELLAGWPTWSRANCTDFPSRLRTRHVLVLAMQGLQDWFWSRRRAQPQPLPVEHILHCVRRDLQSVLLAASTRADYDINWRQGNLAFDFSDGDRRPQIATADVAPGPPDAVPSADPASYPVFTPAAGLGALPEPIPLNRPQSWSKEGTKTCLCCRSRAYLFEENGYCRRCFQPHTGQRPMAPKASVPGAAAGMCDRCGGDYDFDGFAGQRASMAAFLSVQPRAPTKAAPSTNAAPSTPKKAATSSPQKAATARKLSTYWSNTTPTVEETPVEETPVEETPVEETPVEETPVEEATLAQGGARASTLRPRSARLSYVLSSESSSDTSNSDDEYVQNDDDAAADDDEEAEEDEVEDEEDDEEEDEDQDEGAEEDEEEGLSEVQRGKRRARSPSPQAPRKRKAPRGEGDGGSKDYDDDSNDDEEDLTDDEEAPDELPFDDFSDEMAAWLSRPPSPDLAAEMDWF